MTPDQVLSIKPKILTQKQREFYFENGYILLEKLLPDGVNCCVVEIPDVKKGAKIIAVVTEEVDEKELRGKLSEELPNIALPSQFVVMEKMPEMGSGKIDFRSVTTQVQDQLLDEI